MKIRPRGCSPQAARDVELKRLGASPRSTPATRRSTGWPVFAGPAAFDSSGRSTICRATAPRAPWTADPQTAWLGIWAHPAAPYPWISWTARHTASVSRLRLEPPDQADRQPTKVRLSWPGGSAPAAETSIVHGEVLTAPAGAGARPFRLTVARQSELPARRANAPPAQPRGAVGIASLTVPGLAPVSVPRTGVLHTACGSVRVDVGGRRVPLRPSGTVEQLDAGRPLSATGCDGAAQMGEGIQYVRSLPGQFSVDLLRLRSPAPVAPPAATGGGAVVDPGKIGNSSVKGVHVRLNGPSWLVLGQSYSKGWRAECDGRDLGEPRPIDGYANGWRAPADCRDVSFSYAPQNAARVGYAISAVVCLLLLVFLLVGRRRRAPRTGGAPPPLPLERPPPPRLPLPRSRPEFALVFHRRR